MVNRYRLARRLGSSVFSSLLFAIFRRNPPNIQRQLEESHVRFVEFQKKKLEEGRKQSDGANTRR
jgi:hypothetical protein